MCLSSKSLPRPRQQSGTWTLTATQTRTATDLVLETAQQIRGALPDAASDILVTKIMLGVFGCVPAFDTYSRRASVMDVGRAALMRVAKFYMDNEEI